MTLGSAETRTPILAVKLFSKNCNLCDHNTSTLQADRRTDGRLAMAIPRSAQHCAVKLQLIAQLSPKAFIFQLYCWKVQAQLRYVRNELEQVIRWRSCRRLSVLSGVTAANEKYYPQMRNLHRKVNADNSIDHLTYGQPAGIGLTLYVANQLYSRWKRRLIIHIIIKFCNSLLQQHIAH